MHKALIVSVVIPCRKHSEELNRCLSALMNQQPFVDHEIIVIDSSPNDESISKVTEAYPSTRLVKGHKSLLAGEARNLGAKHAKGKYLAFIDADCLPEQGWLFSVQEALNEGYWFVGGPVLDCRPFHPIATADNLLQLPDFSIYRPSGKATHLPGGNMGVHRDAFNAVGGFGSKIAVGEDTILSSTAAKRWPQKVYFSNAMRVCHFGREGMRAYLSHQQQFGYFRAVFGLHISKLHLRLGQIIAFAFLLALKRMVYFIYKGIQWQPISLLRIFVLFPVLSVGLVAWAVGFWKGCRERQNP
jgi:glycosyltransferase involved in cell wall biosynthesis